MGILGNNHLILDNGNPQSVVLAEHRVEQCRLTAAQEPSENLQACFTISQSHFCFHRFPGVKLRVYECNMYHEVHEWTTLRHTGAKAGAERNLLICLSHRVVKRALEAPPKDTCIASEGIQLNLSMSAMAAGVSLRTREKHMRFMRTHFPLPVQCANNFCIYIL